MLLKVNNGGILYSYSLLDECNVQAYRTRFYKKPKYLGVYWEFILPVFKRSNDERFDCNQSNCRDSWYCKYDNEESIRNSLINSNKNKNHDSSK